jgi:predicted permease
MRFPWQQHDSDLKRELDHHLAELTDEFIRRGHSKTEAIQLAKKEFGGPTQIQEQCRDESPWAWLQSLTQDINFGLRQLKQTPIVTAAVVLSLALGIGANSAIVSLMNTILWRTLPVPAAEQLSLVHWQTSGFPNHLADMGAGSMFRDGATSTADFFPLTSIEALQKAAAGRASIAPYSFSNPASVSFSGRPVIAYNRPVGGNFFTTLQVQPILGRNIRDEDNTPDAPAVAVLSHRFFTSFFASDPKVIGQTLRINNLPYQIIGVLPASFYGLIPGDSAELYSPIWKSSEFAIPRNGKVDLTNPRAWIIQAIARRNPGITQESLQLLLNAAFTQSWQQTRAPKPDEKNPVLHLDDGRRGLGDLSRNFRSPLLVLGGLLFLVLLIACANTANLLLARATARSKEVALRMSLGCTPSRLLRQFFTESAILAALGALASIAIAYASANGLAQFLGNRDSSAPLPISLDLPMLATIALISTFTLFLFGLFPAWRASSLDTNAALKEGSGSLGAAARRWWTPGRILIVGQMSLAIILIAAAVLFTENLRNLSAQNTGFDRGNLLVFGLRPGTSGYTKDTLPAFYDKLERTLTSAPGVQEASLATIRPMNEGGWWGNVQEVGKTQKIDAAINGITPSYLPAFNQTLKAGRNFTRADMALKAPKVAIISEDLARKLDPTTFPIGRKIRFGDDPSPKNEPMEIIGIAPAFAFNSMKERPHLLWLPFEIQREEATVVLRTKSNPAALLPSIREIIRQIDPNLPLADPFTMEELVARNLQREHMFATLCGSFGILALLLSAIGLYGVMSYNASRRRNEIGVRLALGAEPHNVVWMVLKEALGLTLLGFALSAPAIYYGSRFLEKELFELKPLNPTLILISVSILGLAATLAAWLPARRASRLDPSSALRQE